jgi:hypothetical protein
VSDLEDNQTWTVPGADLGPGDLYAGVAFLDLDRDFALALTPGDEPFVPVLFSFGVVVAVFEHYAVVAPVSTSMDVEDQEAFTRLIDIARESSDYVRLPQLDPSAWAGDAVALIFRPQTLTRTFIDRTPAQRLASMTDSGRANFIERLRGAR